MPLAALTTMALLALLSPAPPGAADAAVSLHASVGAASPPAVGPLLEEARRAQQHDLEAWARFRFRRRVVRQKVDEVGAVRQEEVLEFLVTPAGDGFDETLLLKDGEPPSPSQVRRHRDKARFTSHYRMALQGEGEEEGFHVGLLLYLTSHRYVGREQRGGVQCHHLAFSPPAEPAGEGMAARITGAMAGDLWLAVDGGHLVRAEARTVRSVPLASFLAGLSELTVLLESAPAAPGVWLPRRIRTESRAHVLGVPLRKRNTYTYSEFRPVD